MMGHKQAGFRFRFSIFDFENQKSKIKNQKSVIIDFQKN
jgi:hypothetical protein